MLNRNLFYHEKLRFTINQKYLSPCDRDNFWTEFKIYHPEITDSWPADPATFTEAPQYWALIMEFFSK